MRRRTSAPRRNSAMPSWYLALSRSCSSRPSDTKRHPRDDATVLLASPRRRASALMADLDLVLENALSSRIAVATEDRRSRPARGAVLPAVLFLAQSECAFRSADRCSDVSRRRRRGRVNNWASARKKRTRTHEHCPQDRGGRRRDRRASPPRSRPGSRTPRPRSCCSTTSRTSPTKSRRCRRPC